MFKKFLKAPLAMSLVLALVLAACGSGVTDTPPPADTGAVDTTTQQADTTDTNGGTPPAQAIAPPVGGGLGEEIRAAIQGNPIHPLWTLVDATERFPTRIDSPNAPIQGGHLRVAIPSDTPVPGIFNIVDYTSGLDGDFLDWFHGGSVFSHTSIRTFGQDGIVTWTHDLDERSMTLTMVEDVYWHDGVPMTLDDLVFAHEAIATPGFGGIRWTDAQRNVVGAQEFHDGEADHISGLVLSNNNRTLKIYFHDFSPSILFFGVWSNPHPRHIFGNISVEDSPGHAMTRTTPIGFGPFIVENVVPGESVLLRANDNYWQGRPGVDYVTLQVVATTMVPSLMLAGEFDIANFRVEDFPDYEHLATNFSFLGDLQNIFGILAFNLGDWNPDTSRLDVHDSPRMGDVRLRRAMGYAINELELTEFFFNGLRFPATSVIPPGHSTFLDFNLAGFYYDPDKARALLDEAGFIDTTGDGWRDDPNGDEFIIQFVARDRADWHFMAPFYIQQWAAIGLRVELYQGRHHDFATILENMAHADNWPNVDIFEAAWQAGFDPNPNGLWGHTINNRSRYINAELEGILDNIGSPQAWNQDWLVQQYSDWQEAFYRHAVALPTNWQIGLFAVNNRVTGYELTTVYRDDGHRTSGGFHRIQLTSETPYRR